MQQRNLVGNLVGRALIALMSLCVIFPLITSAAPQQAPPAAAIASTAPTITGPIKNTTALKDPAHGYPFNSTSLDFKKAGYVEEEFFIEGKANRYITSATSNATIVDSGNAYKTRIVVRRPLSASKFNGTVIVEWTNVSQGHDHEADWFQAAEHFMRSGYAWVGVSAQAVGVQSLTQWSPTRYGTLNVDGPARAAGARGAAQPSPVSFDIFNQAGLAVRGKANINILGNMKVDRVIATGHSQSAGQLGIYFNSVHPLAPVYDAVVLHGGGGKMRTDLNVKIFKILSETDLFSIIGEAALRQPETDKYHVWEVAGASHLDAQNSRGLGAEGLLVAGATPVDGPQTVNSPSISGGGKGIGTSNTLSGAKNDGCIKPPLSRIPFRYVLAAAYDHLVEWVKDGKVPPSGPPIEIVSNVIVRDADGNAKGGIRLSQHAVPTAVNRGDNTQTSGSLFGQFCLLLGSYEPFDDLKLAMMYPSHDVYVKAVKAATDKNLKAGYILKPDADATIAEANKSRVGKK